MEVILAVEGTGMIAIKAKINKQKVQQKDMKAKMVNKLKVSTEEDIVEAVVTEEAAVSAEAVADTEVAVIAHLALILSIGTKTAKDLKERPKTVKLKIGHLEDTSNLRKVKKVEREITDQEITIKTLQSLK